MPQRWSGFEYSDRRHEDFEMWYHVCADAEPGWEDTPEGKASARARVEEERQNANTEREAAKEETGAAVRQRKLDVETRRREKEEAERAKQEETRQRRILEQERAARKVAEELAAREKATEEERKKKAAERAEKAERQRVREEEERKRARKAAEAAVEQRLAEEEERRRKRQAEEAAAARQREDDADRERLQASDEQWARLQTVVRAEYDDLARQHTRLKDAHAAASARLWLEKRRQARLLHPNDNGSAEHELRGHHAGHDAERERLARISLELADLELVVKAITKSRINPPSPSSSGTHSHPPYLSSVPSFPLSACTNTNQRNPYQLDTVVSEIRVLTARDDRPDNRSEQATRDMYDFLIQREEQRRVAAMVHVSVPQDGLPPAGWLGSCTVI